MDAKWIAMIDADEFLYPSTLYSSDLNFLNVSHHLMNRCPQGLTKHKHSCTLLRQSPSSRFHQFLCDTFTPVWSDLSYLMIRWHMFGSNGLKHRPAGSVVDHYRMHSFVDSAQCPPNQMGCFDQSPALSTKLIVNTRCVQHMGTHYATKLSKDPECQTIYVSGQRP